VRGCVSLLFPIDNCWERETHSQDPPRDYYDARYMVGYFNEIDSFGWFWLRECDLVI